MKLYYSHWLFKLPLLKSYKGLTMPWAIYFADANPDKPLIKHELKHGAQIHQDGAVKFFTKYTYEYIRNLIRYNFSHWTAYRQISYEIEARKAEYAE